MSSNISDVLNQLGQLDSGVMGKKIEELTSKQEVIEKMSAAVADNPQIAEMSKKLAGDPRIRQLQRENPDLNRKKALELKRQMNKAANAQRAKKPKVEGVLINESRNLKPITIYLKDGAPDKQEIATHLQAKSLFLYETDRWLVFHDNLSKCKNKRVMKMFPGVTGNKVIILPKEGELTTNDIIEYEKTLS